MSIQLHDGNGKLLTAKDYYTPEAFIENATKLFLISSNFEYSEDFIHLVMSNLSDQVVIAIEESNENFYLQVFNFIESLLLNESKVHSEIINAIWISFLGYNNFTSSHGKIAYAKLPSKLKSIINDSKP